MKVFLIGGTGYIGRAVSTALADAGHAPTVLSRSATSTAKVRDSRVTVIAGALDDLDVLLAQAEAADAVIYLAVAGMRGASASDESAIAAILASYEGTGKSFVLTSGLSAFLGVDVPFIAADTPASSSPDQRWRVLLEESVLTAPGVRSAIIRPSIVYGGGEASALLLGLLAHVVKGGQPFYIGNGSNSIPTVHVADLARVYVETLEVAPPGSSYNVASGSILGWDLALAVGSALGIDADPISATVPEAVAALGPAGGALSMNLVVSQHTITSDLGWSAREASLALELMSKLIPIPGA